MVLINYTVFFSFFVGYNNKKLKKTLFFKALGIIVGDLKPEYILVDEKSEFSAYRCMIADFGSLNIV